MTTTSARWRAAFPYNGRGLEARPCAARPAGGRDETIIRTACRGACGKRRPRRTRWAQLLPRRVAACRNGATLTGVRLSAVGGAELHRSVVSTTIQLTRIRSARCADAGRLSERSPSINVNVVGLRIAGRSWASSVRARSLRTCTGAAPHAPRG
jgi:hypothetical protein